MYHNIFNQGYIQEQFRQEQYKRYQNEQIWRSIECANKLGEFLKSIDEISPEYRNVALGQCVYVLGNYFNRRNTYL